MANTQNYINHLLQNTGITPACSEEERLAAEDIAQIFRNHGFDPEVQEFNAPAPSRLAFAVTGILAFAGALLMGIGGSVLLSTLRGESSAAVSAWSAPCWPLSAPFFTCSSVRATPWFRAWARRA